VAVILPVSVVIPATTGTRWERFLEEVNNT